MVRPRRPIRACDSIIPQRQVSDKDYDLYLKYSQDILTTKSVLDLGEDSKDQELYVRSQEPRKNEFKKKVPRVPTCTIVSNEPSQWKKTFMQNCSIYFILIVVVLIPIYLSLPNAKPKICTFEKFQKEYYKESPSLWKKLKIGIELILNEKTQTPAVYLFLHHGGQNAFQLIYNVAEHSSNCFGKKMIPMESNDFMSSPGVDDYGYTIEKYKTKIRQGNVILIANLNQIPAEAARALHTICDTHSPIAKSVVIFLTLTTQKNEKENPNAIAEATLKELWGSKLSPNELDPLITRVTDQVIVLQS